MQIESSKDQEALQSSQVFHHNQSLQVSSKDHEGPGVAASSIAVAELSAKVSKLCLQYFKDVSSSGADIEHLRNQFKHLAEALRAMYRLIE